MSIPLRSRFRPAGFVLAGIGIWYLVSYIVNNVVTCALSTAWPLDQACSAEVTTNRRVLISIATLPFAIWASHGLSRNPYVEPPNDEPERNERKQMIMFHLRRWGRWCFDKVRVAGFVVCSAVLWWGFGILATHIVSCTVTNQWPYPQVCAADLTTNTRVLIAAGSLPFALWVSHRLFLDE